MNYKIIGGDQKEYGPVTVEQLRQWLAEGRVNGQTLVQPEGESGWKPLNSFPDIAPLAAPSPSPTSPAPFLSQPSSSLAPGAGGGPENVVRVPAILLLIVAGLGIVGSLVGLVAGLSGMGAMNLRNLPPDFPPQVREWIAFSMGPVPSVVGLLLDVLILVGALSMLKLQRWGLALAACILAIFCGNACCCPIGLVAGIWGLVVLVKPEVKSAFR
jgi:hypothetical protein